MENDSKTFKDRLGRSKEEGDNTCLKRRPIWKEKKKNNGEGKLKKDQREREEKRETSKERRTKKKKREKRKYK